MEPTLSSEVDSDDSDDSDDSGSGLCKDTCLINLNVHTYTLLINNWIAKTVICIFMHNLPDWLYFPPSSAAEMHETERSCMKIMTVVFKVMTGGNDCHTWSTTV